MYFGISAAFSCDAGRIVPHTLASFSATSSPPGPIPMTDWNTDSNERRLDPTSLQSATMDMPSAKLW